MASTKRRIVRWVAGVLAVLLFVVLTWVMPAVYHARYDPATKDGVGTAAAADTAWHPIPTAEQDQIYLEQTRTNASHPGLGVEGRDGYWFLGDDFQANFAQAMGRRFYSREEVQLTVDAVKSRNAWLAEQNIASEFIVVPAKWSVYSDKMPEWTDGQITPHILDQLITADAMSFPDLRPDLTAQRATADTYSRLNTHWTQFGAYVGFTSVMARLQADHPEIGELPVPTLTGTTASDDNNEFAGIVGTPGPNNWASPEFAAPLSPYTLTSPDGAVETVPGDRLIDITEMPVYTDNPTAGNSRRALVLADSATTYLSPYLAGAFGSTMMVRHWVDNPSMAPNIPALVQSYQPDVVLFLVSERNLNVITPDSQMWQAAAAFDGPGAQPFADWSSAGGASSLAVDRSDLAGPVTVGLPSPPPTAIGVRIEVQATGPGSLTITGTTASGPVTSSLSVSQGANVLFARIPSGLVEPRIVLQRTAGDGTWTATSISARTIS